MRDNNLLLSFLVVKEPHATCQRALTALRTARPRPHAATLVRIMNAVKKKNFWAVSWNPTWVSAGGRRFEYVSADPHTHALRHAPWRINLTDIDSFWRCVGSYQEVHGAREDERCKELSGQVSQALGHEVSAVSGEGGEGERRTQCINRTMGEKSVFGASGQWRRGGGGRD